LGDAGCAGLRGSGVVRVYVEPASLEPEVLMDRGETKRRTAKLKVDFGSRSSGVRY
jgi:hypothetical protein